MARRLTMGSRGTHTTLPADINASLIRMSSKYGRGNPEANVQAIREHLTPALARKIAKMSQHHERRGVPFMATVKDSAGGVHLVVSAGHGSALNFSQVSMMPEEISTTFKFERDKGSTRGKLFSSGENVFGTKGLHAKTLFLNTAHKALNRFPDPKYLR